MTPQAARRATADHVRMGSQRFQQWLGPRERVTEEMARGVGAATVDTLNNVRLRLLPKPFQPGDLAVFAGLFELLNRVDSQFVVHGLDLLWTEPGDVEHRDPPGRRCWCHIRILWQSDG